MPGKELLEQMLDHLPSGLFTLSPDHVVLLRNRAAMNLVPQIEVGMNIWDALEPAANVEKVDRMMVDDIVDLSKNSFGELGLELEHVSVVPILEDVCETMRPQIEAKGKTLILSNSPDLPDIEVDGQRIRQIVFNLLQNAHVHTASRSTLRVPTAMQEEGVAIIVADDGEG